MARVRLRFIIDPDLALAALCAGILALPAVELGSESFTLNVGFPTPNAVYKGIMTTGANTNAGYPTLRNSYLNRSLGNTIMVPPVNSTGTVSIGLLATSEPIAKLQVGTASGHIAGTGYFSANNGAIHLGGMGIADLPYGYHGSASDLNLRPNTANFSVRNGNGATEYMRMGVTGGPGGLIGATVTGAFGFEGGGYFGSCNLAETCAGSSCACTDEGTLNGDGDQFVLNVTGFWGSNPPSKPAGAVMWCCRFRNP